MKHWIVVSPETWDVIPVLDDGTGPIEYFCYSVSVKAETKREAIKIALRHPEMQGWVDQQRGDNRNPMWGLKAVDPVCKHGTCQCDICFQDCADCIADLKREAMADAMREDDRAATYDEYHPWGM